MPNSYMNLPELASLLGMDSRRAERMAQRGQIPCQKVGGLLRFNRAAVTEWVQQSLGTFERGHLASMDAGISSCRLGQLDEAIVAPLLRSEAINTELPARTKNSVLKEIVELADNTGLLYDAEALLNALQEREQVGSTALPGGIAIPHPRRCLTYSLAEPILVIAHVRRGIGFGAPDGRLTNLFLMTCSQDDQHHLHILARLCRMFGEQTFADAIRNAATSQDVVALMCQRELAVLTD